MKSAWLEAERRSCSSGEAGLMMADGMAKNSGTAVTGPVGTARLEVVGDGPGGVFREELARPVVTGRLGAHPPGPQVSLAAQVGVRQLRVDAGVVYVLAAVGAFAHDVFWEVRHGNSSVERGKDVKTCTGRPVSFPSLLGDVRCFGGCCHSGPLSGW